MRFRGDDNGVRADHSDLVCAAAMGFASLNPSYALLLSAVLLILFGGDRGGCRTGTRQIERQQLRQRVLLRNVGRPAVGCGDGGIEVAVRIGEPLRALIVEVGERALLEL